METIFYGNDQQIEDVQTAASEAYRLFHKKEGYSLTQLPYLPFCFEITEILADQLTQKGYKVSFRRNNRNNSKMDHQHLDLGNDWVADPSWKQFIPGVDEYLRSQYMMLASSDNSRFRGIGWIERFVQRLWLRDTQQNPQRLELYPDVLVSKIQDLPGVLEKAGVSSDVIPFWTEAVIV